MVLLVASFRPLPGNTQEEGADSIILAWCISRGFKLRDIRPMRNCQGHVIFGKLVFQFVASSWQMVTVTCIISEWQGRFSLKRCIPFLVT
jgi:hypothetical protein